MAKEELLWTLPELVEQLRRVEDVGWHEPCDGVFLRGKNAGQLADAIEQEIAARLAAERRADIWMRRYDLYAKELGDLREAVARLPDAAPTGWRQKFCVDESAP